MRICGKRNHEPPPGCDSLWQALTDPAWLATDLLKQCFLPYGHDGPHRWGQES